MRAIVIKEFGGPEALEVAEVPVPEAGPGEVRIRVEAVALNPVDLLTASGFFVELGRLPQAPVYGVGWDVAGVVDAVGEGVTGHAPGDRVIAMSDQLGRAPGVQAEYAVLPEAHLAPFPAGVTAPEAASLPLNASTADQALDLMALPEGASLLVTGAAGGVGGYAVELGKARGLRVVATAGAADEGVVRGFGAAEFIPRGQSLTTYGQVDGVLDAAMVGAEALAATRDGGAFVAVNGNVVPTAERGIHTHFVQVTANGPRLAELAALVAKGELSVRVAEVFSFDQVTAAYERLAAGGYRGRVVLVP
ncbi:NADPH:quinone reductase-like Zn-dependent oxidoreductase [Crossiella equi]|uniref:NADPH:quinone reductase-like Zn-dependent oxidoreductase n=1 Tax=Crossiella equi TaxID=130796 RepID=A0ABS5AAS6_9PSEU|nr:NADP-dependent oxidoreductase [Crossiella equi]MBP2473681.1 NADPH:quinone reductase-like Zn-dependent oxidoreductase [Crossiella equi]